VSIRIRPEESADRAAVQNLIRAAFASADQPSAPVVEVGLTEELRLDPGWIPGLTLVADRDAIVVGQVTSSYGELDDANRTRMVGIGPVAVLPAEQGAGIGSLLMRAVVDAADAAGESALVLLGSPDFYGRFGFVAASEVGIESPDPSWGRYFQALPLSAHRPGMTGRFRYAAPFDSL